jgi:hypothetical protein
MIEDGESRIEDRELRFSILHPHLLRYLKVVIRRSLAG